MKKVITYGTFDLLHYGHKRLLERAKELGDYLIVGVTSDDYDKERGKINVQQPLSERIAAVRETGLANKIIVEEYEGQKIDDIKKYKVDIFTVGSDWIGKFDYLNSYCDVIYLERTKGISSSELREKERSLTMGIICDTPRIINKFQGEDKFVNGIEITGVCSKDEENLNNEVKLLEFNTDDYMQLLKNVDSVYINVAVEKKYEIIKEALKQNKHVLCESPICDDKNKTRDLFKMAQEKHLILMESIKTAYATAYERLLLLVKAGKIGNVLSIDAVCTDMSRIEEKEYNMNSFENWGPNAILPIFQILGTDYKDYRIFSHFKDKDKKEDVFTKIDFLYEKSTASIKIAEGAKSEGELVITGTQGYIYVPAPWWKTEYFEIRHENMSNNKRIFYQLDGEGIRYEMVSFAKSVQKKEKNDNIAENVSIAIAEMTNNFKAKKNLFEI